MTIILFLLGLALLGLGVTAWVVQRTQRSVAVQRGRELEVTARGLAWRWLVLGGAIALLLGLVTTFVVVIPAGNVGVVTNFGRVEERTLPAGLQVVTPIAEQVVLVDVRVQPHPFQEIDAASREYQTVKLTGNMNYHIDPQQAFDLYRTVGLDFAEKVIDPAFNDFIKEVVPRYPVTEILAKRDEIRRLAKDELGANLARYHIIVDDIYLSNIRFSPEYEAAVEQKQVAEQQVSTERQILEQKRVQAQQRVAEAQGTADAAVVSAKGEATATIEKARGQAEANRQLAASLSDPVLQYSYIQRLTDKIQVMLVPSGQGFLFDLKGLLAPKPD
ncbi:MAG TPA: prohibitin family protein [Candidatus Limnocylindrales bacterium]|nr:prohibitin family protein [Candidatus Limnocylindrales bacterium]